MSLKDTSSVWDVYLKWHEYQLEKHDKEDFSGIFKALDKRQTGYVRQSVTASEVDVFKNFTQLEKTQVSLDKKSGMPITFNLWPLRLSNKINSKIKGLSTDKQQQILETIFSL